MTPTVPATSIVDVIDSQLEPAPSPLPDPSAVDCAAYGPVRGAIERLDRRTRLLLFVAIFQLLTSMSDNSHVIDLLTRLYSVFTAP